MATSLLDANPSALACLDDEELAFALQQEEIARAERYERQNRRAARESHSEEELFQPMSPPRIERDWAGELRRGASPGRWAEELRRDASPRPIITRRQYRPPAAGLHRQATTPLNDSDVIIIDDVDEPGAPQDTVLSDHLLAQRLHQEEMKRLNARSMTRFNSFSGGQSLPNRGHRQDDSRSLASVSSSNLSSRRTSNNASDRVFNFALSEAELFSSAIGVDQVNPAPRPTTSQTSRPLAATGSFTLFAPANRASSSRNRGLSSLFHRLAHTDADFSANDYETLLSLDEAVNRKKGLSKTELDQLPSFTYKASMNDANDDNKQCSVCFDDFQAREKITCLICSHKFHHKCIKPWLKENRCCPLCKKDAVSGV